MAPQCNHALFVTAEGELWAVGNAEDGQIGIELKGPADKNTEVAVPKRVAGPLDGKVVIHAAVAQVRGGVDRHGFCGFLGR
jgi:alpha-tubulin suppressor-like RCC1 family protein